MNADTGDVVERTEAALAIACGCNQSDCGWTDFELGAQARDLLPELVAELKAARAEIQGLAAKLGVS